MSLRQVIIAVERNGFVNKKQSTVVVPTQHLFDGKVIEFNRFFVNMVFLPDFPPANTTKITKKN